MFDREKLLSPNTLERIAAGIPLIVDHPDAAAFFQVILRRNADIATLDDVVPAICTGGGHHAIAKVQLRQIICRNQTHNTPVIEDSPSPCVTTAHGGGIVRTNDDPVSTISTISTDAFVRIFEPFLVKVTGTLNSRESAGCRVKTLDRTLGVVTRKNGIVIAQPRVTLLGKSKGIPGVLKGTTDSSTHLIGFRMLHVSELIDILQMMEDDFRVPVVHVQTARLWAIQNRLNVREPRTGYGRLLAEFPRPVEAAWLDNGILTTARRGRGR